MLAPPGSDDGHSKPRQQDEKQNIGPKQLQHGLTEPHAGIDQRIGEIGQQQA